MRSSTWGNLVYLAHNVRIGFYGYGYEMVAPLVETQDARLASVEDIALMKLDALLARAARKDFYDLYFICHKIPLRTILDLAAEQDIDLQLLSPVAWEQVKAYFIKQSWKIAANWLA